MVKRSLTLRALCLSIGVSCWLAQAQNVTTADLANQRMKSDFTLVFEVEREDVSTAEVRKSEYGESIADYVSRVKQGFMTQSEANQTLSVLKKELSTQKPKEHFTLTLSARGGVLLVQE